MVDVSQHELVPEHTLIDESEIESVLSEYDIKRAELPKIKRKDPAMPDGRSATLSGSSVTPEPPTRPSPTGW